MSKISKFPPLIQFVYDIQKEYPKAIVATEMGNFFEILGIIDDGVVYGYAKEAAEILDIALTRKNKSNSDSPYMCGVPIHVADSYFLKLTKAGHTVVVIEQDLRGVKADQNKQIPRKITKILTPSTVIDRTVCENVYFVSLYKEPDINIIGVSLVDLTTGEVKITEFTEEDLNDFILKYQPKEILVNGRIDLNNFSNIMIHHNVEKNMLKKTNHASVILEHIYQDISHVSNFEDSILSVLSLDKWRFATLAVANFFNYLSQIDYHKILLQKIAKPEIIELANSLSLSNDSCYSLDLKSFDENNNNTLYKTLNECQTSMGSRLLKNWILNPSSSIEKLTERYDKVSHYIKNLNFDSNDNTLKEIYDLHRLNRKMLIGKLMPHELLQIYQSLIHIRIVLIEQNSIHIKQLKTLIDFLEEHIAFEKLANNDIGMYQYFNFEKIPLELITMHTQYIMAYDKLEKFVQELPNEINNKIKIIEKPTEYQLIGSKGVLKIIDKKRFPVSENAGNVILLGDNEKTVEENFPQLSKKAFFAKILFEKNMEIHHINFQKNLYNDFGSFLYTLAETIAEYDVLTCFAKISLKRNYTRPDIVNTDKQVLVLDDFRHPIVELNKTLKEPFVANSVSFDESKNIMVIYGANSAGKSTLLKGVALNVIMSQIGCFVPAKKMTTSVFEHIKTRISSNDNLSNGMSTFVVEMTELQNSLKYINKKTLLLLDEIGRGTSSNDGESIGYATLSYISTIENRTVTLFATHYHNLYDKIKKMQNLQIKNFHTDIDLNDKLLFSRKLEDGPGNGSYGLVVAKSCGVPDELIRIAQNYNKEFYGLKISRYNTNVSGILCKICKTRPVQETNHITQQKQGKIKKIKDINGIELSINDRKNLELICSSCHREISNKQQKGNNEK